MSIYKINPDNIESYTVTTHPKREFSSSSIDGVTGAIYLYSRRSSIEKETGQFSSFIDAQHTDSNLDLVLRDIQSKSKLQRSIAAGANIKSSVEKYLDSVNDLQASRKNDITLEIERLTPTYNFSENTLKKLIIKDLLNPYYRSSGPNYQWGYTNYNSLNFFSASTVPSASVLIYPNVENENNIIHENHISGAYALSGAFSFEFYIKPTQKQTENDIGFKTGCIMHLSSAYAVSLMTGTLKDHEGKSDAFRIKLQLSHSADISPSSASPGDYPNNLVFLSDDNSIKFNKWNHVVITWGTTTVENGTGSFWIDGEEKGRFVIPSGTVSPRLFSSTGNPDCLFLGNYYEGNNFSSNSTSYFFSTIAAEREGLEELISDNSIDKPSFYRFTHPLNAELHDLSIRRKYLPGAEINASGNVAPADLDNTYLFYLPPFFIQSSSYRKVLNEYGGVMQTPFFSVNASTDDPFNIALSFGVGGHMINLENFLRDFATNNTPRKLYLTASTITYTTTAKEANEFLYDSKDVVARNLLILPCDDGNFTPNFDLLKNELLLSKSIDDLGTSDYSLITLDNMIDGTGRLFGSTFEDVNNASAQQNFLGTIVGYSPESPGIAPGKASLSYSKFLSSSIESNTYIVGAQAGAPLPIYERTLDQSSNQITIFDISNLFYGNQIKPGTLYLKDSLFTGSSGHMSITLKDDEFGNLYRADCSGSYATWASVGNVYYSEGLVLIKSPHLYFFGKEQFEIGFKGEQNVHVLKFSALAPANQLNSSSNPAFEPISASLSPYDNDKNFVYISNINIHDDNMNVVMKTQLAQPIVKRWNEKILFKIRYDF